MVYAAVEFYIYPAQVRRTGNSLDECGYLKQVATWYITRTAKLKSHSISHCCTQQQSRPTYPKPQQQRKKKLSIFSLVL